MTIVIENASFSFAKAIKELAKIDGAKVKTESRIKQKDLFYSEENIAVLKKSIEQIENGKVVVKEPIEV